MDSQPVTIVVNHVVKDGMVEQFEAWLKGITAEALKFPGHQGINVIKPSDKKKLEYVVIFRFDDYMNLKKWEESEERRIWAEKLSGLVKTDSKIEKFSGIEYWFSLPSDPLKNPPPRYKMVLVTWLAIFPLSSLLQKIAAIFLQGAPSVVVGIIVSAIMITSMTYFVMPIMIRLFSFWLYK